MNSATYICIILYVLFDRIIVIYCSNLLLFFSCLFEFIFEGHMLENCKKLICPPSLNKVYCIVLYCIDFLLALWTAIKHCLAFISWSGLSGGVRHALMATVWTFSINLQPDNSGKSINVNLLGAVKNFVLNVLWMQVEVNCNIVSITTQKIIMELQNQNVAFLGSLQCIVNLDRNTHVHGDLVCNKQIVTIECCFGYGMICSSLLFYILVDAVQKCTFDFQCVVTFTGTQI